MTRSRLARSPLLRHALPGLAGLAGLAVLVHGVDVNQVGVALRGADWRWLSAALALSGLSLVSGIVMWSSLVRDRAPRIARRTLACWHVRSLLAGQVVPTGAGGDAVRAVAVARMSDTGTALGSLAMARVMAALAMALWGVAGAGLLHEAVGTGVVVTAAVGVVLMLVALGLALRADLVLHLLARRDGPVGRRVRSAVSPIASTLSSWRERPALITIALLTAAAGWGLNLAALTFLGRAVGVEAGWQVFAVTMPVTLAATWLPVAANGMGVREGILVGLLVHAGAGSGPAMALAVLVDLQMLPFALVGGLLWLRGCGVASAAAHEAEARLAGEPAAVPGPVPVPVAIPVSG